MMMEIISLVLIKLWLVTSLEGFSNVTEPSGTEVQL